MIRRLPTRRSLLQARALLAAAGLVLSLPALLIVLSLGTGGPLDPIGSQARAMERGVDQLDAALARVEVSLTAAGTTLDDGRRASTDASAMTASLGNAMSELASASSLQVLGVQPFAQLAPRFSELAARSQAVAASLTSTAASLGTTRTELAALQTDVSDLRETLRGLGAGAQQDALGGASLVVTRLLLALLVAWFAGASAVALLLALRDLQTHAREGS